MKIKTVVQMIAKDNGLSLERLGNKIGRPYHSLGKSLRDESVKVKDLQKCFEAIGEPLVIVYKGDNFIIECETNKTK